MINKVLISPFLCILLILLSSCAGSLHVSMKNCLKSRVQFAQVNARDASTFHADHTFTTKFWSYGISSERPTDVELKDVLTDNGYSCVNIKYMRYTLGQSLWDQVFSVVPFIQRSSIKVELALY